MTEASKKAVAVGLLILAALMLMGSFYQGSGISTPVLLPAAATLFASFLGATYAFTLQRQQKTEEELRARVLAGNTAIFILGQQMNALWNIQRKFINPVRNHPFFFIEMLPALPLNYDRLRFDFASLYFLLETDHRDILFEFPLLEARFHSAIQIFNERSLMHREEVQPALARAGVRQDVEYPPEALEPVLGHSLFVRLQGMTTQVVDHVDKVTADSSDLANRFHQVMKSLFKGEKIISVKVEET